MTFETQNRFSSDTQQTADDLSKSSAARPADQSALYNLALYNIGSDVLTTPTTDALSSEISEMYDMVHDKNKRIIDGLTSEICDMAHDKCADVVGFWN